ncbi:nuclear receptor coactivator 5 [Dendroctonus ponderosae]|nr:nuclear receptor coactivator 5 [Dendroctonus ponderosae]XP_019763528.2 nuclear receptor coactivator 5 [Dendroctonus ponderosae]
MYRTDKQFMKNPATAPSRIYIGSIPKTIIADDLEAKFSKYGKILGLVINSGFAFIQYEFENEAQSAIRMENGAVMMGRKITVRQSFAGKDSGAPPNKSAVPVKVDPPPQGRENDPAGGNNRIQEDRGMQFEPPDEPKKPIDTQTKMEEVDDGPPIRPTQQSFNEDRGRRSGPIAVRGRIRPREGFDPFERLPFPDRGLGPYYEDYGPPPPLPAPAPEILPPPDRNDCEIIVVSRVLTEYAEFIESRLKQMGLIVDLLFPNEDVAIGKVLANISSRGCLYAILVMPQNEEQRSLTLNILHGIPQEHRNMPLEDAVLLVQRNFEAYMRGEKAPENAVKMSLSDRHPIPVQMLLNLLAENRMLSTSQYDRIIKYLQERRELQSAHEIAEGITQASNEAPTDKQTELQSRILNILNKANDPAIPKSITSMDSAAKEPATPLLKDPSVQKALDSILSGDMFKGLTERL